MLQTQQASAGRSNVGQPHAVNRRHHAFGHQAQVHCHAWMHMHQRSMAPVQLATMVDVSEHYAATLAFCMSHA
jgi:hypothetical protein